MKLHCELGVMERRFINRYQGGFPLAGRPFHMVAAKLGTTESALISLVADLLERGVLSRFGPLYDATRLGGETVLAAMKIPEADFDEAARRVNILPAVAHNYKRTHDLNMWFVVSAQRGNSVIETLDAIEREIGLPVFRFPKLREFYLGLWFQVNEDGSVETVPVQMPPTWQKPRIDARDEDIIAVTQKGIPLAPEPLREISHATGIPQTEVFERIARMTNSGIIRRIGAIPNHYRLGIRGNAMTVWDVPDEKIEELGSRIGRLPFVSHCYERPRQPGIWPYNLFAMVHDINRVEVERKIDLIAAELNGHCRSHTALYSTAVLKKTGLRIQPREKNECSE